MEPLLHERLRNCFEANPPGSDWVKVGDEHIEMVSRDALAIANEIERFYIPKPRFENGEPVNFGENFAAKHGQTQQVTSIHYTPCHYYINSKESSGQHRYCDTVRREHQNSSEDGNLEVFDSAGIPVSVGDVLYNIRTNESVTVTCLNGTILADFNGEVIEFDPLMFTHKVPDAIDADGSIVKVGDVVWSITGVSDKHPFWMLPQIVMGIKDDLLCFQVDESYGGTVIPSGSVIEAPSSKFTHTYPLFDRFGARICIGDEMYAIDGSGPLIPKYFVSNQVVVENEAGETSIVKPGELSHDNPVSECLDADGNAVGIGDVLWEIGKDDHGAYHLTYPVYVNGIQKGKIHVRHYDGIEGWYDPSGFSKVKPVVDRDGERLAVGNVISTRSVYGYFEIVELHDTAVLAKPVNFDGVANLFPRCDVKKLFDSKSEGGSVPETNTEVQREPVKAHFNSLVVTTLYDLANPNVSVAETLECFEREIGYLKEKVEKGDFNG